MKEDYGENDYLQAFGEKRGKKNCCLKSDLRRDSDNFKGRCTIQIIHRCGEAFILGTLYRVLCTTCCFVQVINYELPGRLEASGWVRVCPQGGSGQPISERCRDTYYFLTDLCTYILYKQTSYIRNCGIMHSVIYSKILVSNRN